MVGEFEICILEQKIHIVFPSPHFLVILGFELGLCASRQVLYHLSHTQKLKKGKALFALATVYIGSHAFCLRLPMQSESLLHHWDSDRRAPPCLAPVFYS
jgi:hypothetical protein